MMVFGKEIIPTIVDFCTRCLTSLPFCQLHDTLNLVIMTIQNHKPISLIKSTMGLVYQKAFQSPLPDSNISDPEKQLNGVHSQIGKLISTELEETGLLGLSDYF
jgi:hypothetical protein